MLASTVRICALDTERRAPDKRAADTLAGTIRQTNSKSICVPMAVIKPTGWLLTTATRPIESASFCRQRVSSTCARSRGLPRV